MEKKTEEKMEEKNLKGTTAEKILLVFMSILFGYLVSYVIITTMPNEEIKKSIKIVIFLSIISSLAYPIIGAVVVKNCEWLRQWAYKGQIENWSDGERLVIGAFWPISIFWCLFIYIFLAIIHRTYYD